MQIIYDPINKGFERKEVPPPCDFELDGPVFMIDQVIPSNLECIDDVICRIVDALDQKGYVAADKLRDLDLVMHEALANAIIHGNRCSRTKTVRLGVAMGEDRSLEIVVKDLGSGFDPSTIPEPVSAHHLLMDRGRGIFIIRQLMDNIQFRFRNGTEIYMRRSSLKQSPK
ncbi:MAG: ATP-binding protein [Terriglobia bacterium]